jgi:hypothetical protein
VGIFRQFLLARAESVIVVIGHSTFFKVEHVVFSQSL